MIIQTKAFARAGLIGNPSDGYFGKAISVLMRNFGATVTCYESPRLTILPRRSDRLEFDDIDSLIDDVHRHGYYGGIRLIKATIKRFSEYCREHGIVLPSRNFTIEYETTIPVRVGLAGSSGIVTATMRALMSFYGVEIAKPILPGLILSVELNELGISAGLQDRVIQVYEGVVFMDFNKELMEFQGYGKYESLDPAKLPPLYVAYHEDLAESTEITHNDLRSRYNRGDPQVIDGMDRFAELAQETRDLLAAGKGEEIAPLMVENFDLRARLCNIRPGNFKLVEIGRNLGAAAKFAGSGGAVIGVYDGDPERLQRLAKDYADFGATLIEPQIA